MHASMDYDRSTDEDDNNSEEEDWLDTNWDTVQVDRSLSKTQDGRMQPEANIKGAKSEEVSAPLMTRMQLNDHKAGMQGLDKEHINQIIYEASKGSKFFENERRKEEQVQRRIQEQERHKNDITDSELRKGLKEVDDIIAELESCRDLSQTIVHVDMDAFYAAVEMKDDPSLRNKPMAVGGIGMLSTSNYEARKYGVRAAMPGFIGKKLCPQLVIVPLNFAKYTEVSRQVRQIFADYDANFCPMSLDEAYLNFTEHLLRRQTMSATERSVLKRCQTPADAALCRCDLNLTIRKIVLKEGSSQASEQYCDQNVCDMNGNTEKGSDKKGGVEGVVQVRSTEKDLSAQKRPSSLSEANTAVTQVAQHKDGQRAELCKAGDQVLETGSQCPACGKAVPQYEVVTFDVDAESAVHEMRCRIEQRTCLTASAGIAPNMMLSKVCSDQNKPNGQYCLSTNRDDIMQFVHKLPIRKISGIGRVTEQLLGALGVSTCSDLFEQRALLYHLYSTVSFSYFMRVACGIGSTQVASAREEERKSMSTEQTFGELSRPEELYSKCLELCRCLAQDLAREQLVGKTVSLKLKTTDFQIRTRAQTINNYTADADTIFTVARGILRAEIQSESPKPLCLRLMGVRMSKLKAESDCPQEKQDTILGFFRKATASSHQSGPTKVTASSSVQKHEMSVTESASSSKSHVAEKEEPDKENSTSVKFAEHSEDSCFRGENEPVGISIEKSHPGTVLDIPQEKLVENECEMEESIPVQSTELLNTGFGHRDEISVGDKAESNRNESMNQNVETYSENRQITLQSANSLQSESRTQRFTAKHAASPVCKPGYQSPRKDNSRERAGASHGPSALADSTPCEVQVHEDSTHSDVTIRNDFDNDDTERSSAFFQRVSAFTCPVCCKSVSCINLTDFNAHIDRCLQPDFQQATHTTLPTARLSSGKQPSLASKKSKSSFTTSKKSLSQSSSVKKSPTTQKTMNRTCAGSSSTSTSSRTLTAKGSTSGAFKEHSTAELAPTTSMLTTFSNAGLERSEFDSEQIDIKTGSDTASAADTRNQENSAYRELAATDYMVCPLCCAERADWTLETFNQHVDACLNRDTISQILREQRTSEEQPRKRSAGIHQDEKHHQQSKKSKKTQSPKSDRSILSFFKT